MKNLKKELRSLKELTNNLTTRTDGSRATPVNDRAFEIAFAIFESDNRSCIVNMQRLVRFRADYRIKPHAPPLVVGPRQFLWVPILQSYSSGGVLNALAWNLIFFKSEHSAFTVQTTRVSNPICSLYFRSLKSVNTKELLSLNRCSSVYLKILSLLTEFYSSVNYSSEAVLLIV